VPGQQLVDGQRVGQHPRGRPARSPDDHHLDRRLRGRRRINEGYPGQNKNNSDNGAVWGHWINYTDTAGTPNGQICVISTSPTNCVPALTR
jgi:hypothetical protein